MNTDTNKQIAEILSLYAERDRQIVESLGLSVQTQIHQNQVQSQKRSGHEKRNANKRLKLI